MFLKLPDGKTKEKKNIGITVWKIRSGNEHRISNVIYGMYNVSVGTERQAQDNRFSFCSKCIENFYFDVS